MNKKNIHNGFTLIEIMIVIAIIAILSVVAIPNFIAYRNKSFCTMAESDAMHIEGDIVGYFAMASHTAITTSDVKYTPSDNIFSITSDNPNVSITIFVTDVSNRCPVEYKNSNRSSVDGSGWNGNVYTKVIIH